MNNRNGSWNERINDRTEEEIEEMACEEAAEILYLLMHENLTEIICRLRALWPSHEPYVRRIIPEVARCAAVLYRYECYREERRLRREGNQQEGSQLDNEEGEEEGQN